MSLSILIFMFQKELENLNLQTYKTLKKPNMSKLGFICRIFASNLHFTIRHVRQDANVITVVLFKLF